MLDRKAIIEEHCSRAEMADRLARNASNSDLRASWQQIAKSHRYMARMWADSKEAPIDPAVPEGKE